MRHALVWVVLFLVAATPTFSQTNDQKAQDAYYAALGASQSGAHAEAVRQLDLAVSLLGRTNIKIQPLLAKSLYAVKDYVRTRSAIDGYLSLNPDKSLAEYAGIMSLAVPTDTALRQDDIDYGRAIGQSDDGPFASYLATYPYGKHRSEVLQRKDDAAFSRAQNRGTWEAWWAYVDAYPSGRRVYDARQRITNIDTDAYSAAQRNGTAAAYQNYLSQYGRGQNAPEARLRLAAAIDDEAFAAAQARGSKDAYQSYRDRFPLGRHITEATSTWNSLDQAEKQRKAAIAQARREEARAELADQIKRADSEASGHRAIGVLKVAGGVGCGAVAAFGLLSSFGTVSESGTPPGLIIGAIALGPAIYCLVTCGHDFEQARNDASRADDARRELINLAMPAPAVTANGRPSPLPTFGLSIRVPLWR
jgi:outer membrane protein assembly factor BamD (BamD/ComL family)